jgi:hypothetical protein
LSGVAGMWCGIGMLVIMLGFYRLGHTGVSEINPAPRPETSIGGPFSNPHA